MNKARTILIVTQEYDPHADCMVQVLQDMGHIPLRLHTADIPQQIMISFHFREGTLGGAFSTNGRQLRLEEIDAVWWRRPARYKLPDTLSEDEKIFARLELQYSLHGIWDAMDCYWMSRPHNIRLASYKPGQLRRAATLGFSVPRTLITTDPEQVRAFYEACNHQIIYKVLSDPMLGFAGRADEIAARCRVEGGPGQAPYIDWSRIQARTAYTTLVGREQLAMLDTVRFAPCQFQEYVAKQLELRVMLIGDELFVAEIHSQVHETTRHDWRHYEVEIPYKKGTLPADMAQSCYDLVKSYGLNYGAIDLILTPDGRYVFLEINPNGQWLWVQHLVPELKMKEALAARLIKGNDASH